MTKVTLRVNGLGWIVSGSTLSAHGHCSRAQAMSGTKRGKCFLCDVPRNWGRVGQGPERSCSLAAWPWLPQTGLDSAIFCPATDGGFRMCGFRRGLGSQQ